MAIVAGTTAVTEGGSIALVTVTLTLSGDAGATLAVPVSANLPTGHADYTPTGVTFAVATGSGATLDISVAAVDDNLVEATLESFAVRRRA